MLTLGWLGCMLTLTSSGHKASVGVVSSRIIPVVAVVPVRVTPSSVGGEGRKGLPAILSSNETPVVFILVTVVTTPGGGWLLCRLLFLSSRRLEVFY